MKFSYLLILGIIITFSFGINYAFAASVSVPQGTSVPGCETTNECFLPSEVSIPVGGQVIWSNDDSAAHTVTGGSSADGPSGIFDSSLFMAGTTFSHSFNQSGAFPYFCMVHPWMNGIVRVGNYPDSGSTSNTPITVILNDSEFYLDVLNQVVRAKVEMRDFSPSDGQYFMKVIHLPTGKTVKDSEIYPKAAGNDLYSIQIAHALSESDIMVGGEALLGQYEIQIISEKGAHTGSAKFSILETSTQPKTEPVTETKIVIDATADKRTFDENETIHVTGSVNDLLYGDTISLRVISLDGNIMSIKQVPLDSEGTFSYNLDANNNLFAENGEYTIQLIYGTDKIRKDILFSYVGNEPPKPVPVPIPEPKVEPAPKGVESKPKIEQTSPKVVENTIEKQTPLKQDKSNYDYTFILILLGIAIAGIVGGVTAIKKRSKGKEDSSTSSNTKSKSTESKEDMEWEGI